MAADGTPSPKARNPFPLGAFLRVAIGIAACSGSNNGASSGSGGDNGDHQGDGRQPEDDPGSGGGGNAGQPGEAMDASHGAGGGSSFDASTHDAAEIVDQRSIPLDASTGARNTARPIGTTAAGNGFWEYLPPGYGLGEPSPLLIFLHGSAENGSGGATDLQKLATSGPPNLIRINRWPAARPFVVLSPQHAGGGCPSSSEIHAFIAFALTHYRVDASRVYLTALSCGALGSAAYLAQHSGQQIAAAVLFAGNITPTWTARGCDLLDEIGLWVFHGSADQSVSIAGDDLTMPKFTACPLPRKEVNYTVYPGVGHDCWTRTYNLSAGHDIYSWLLGFRQ